MEIVQEEYQDEWINLEKEKPVYFFVKRVIDIVLSLCGLIVLSPVFLLIAILIKKDDGGDVFYKHKRIGHMNQDIYLYKFRSMTSKYKTFDEFYQTLSIEQKEEWDENFKLENDPRITKIGNFLRKTSLDELPQIINILKGDMSIIGPRPVVDDEIEKIKLCFYLTNQDLQDIGLLMVEVLLHMKIELIWSFIMLIIVLYY